VFGSGNRTAQPSTSPETVCNVDKASANMVRLDIEKNKQREVKEKQRVAKAKKRATKAAALNFPVANNNDKASVYATRRVLRYE
jgi:hypothetical protein